MAVERLRDRYHTNKLVSLLALTYRRVKNC